MLLLIQTDYLILVHVKKRLLQKPQAYDFEHQPHVSSPKQCSVTLESKFKGLKGQHKERSRLFRQDLFKMKAFGFIGFIDY